MKNKILKASVLALAIILLFQAAVFASVGKLTLITSTGKDSYKVGDKITVTVDWTQEMESAGFTLKFDASKLKFESMSLKDYDDSKKAQGEVKFGWALVSEGTALTKVTYTFTAIAEGEVTITPSAAKGFATGNLEQPSGYEYVSKTITITADNAGGNQGGNENQGGTGGVDQDENQNQGGNTNQGTNQNKPAAGNTTTTTDKTNTTNKKDNTTAPGKVPYAGSETTIISAIVLVTIAGTVGFIGYRRLADVK